MSALAWTMRKSAQQLLNGQQNAQLAGLEGQTALQIDGVGLAHGGVGGQPA